MYVCVSLGLLNAEFVCGKAEDVLPKHLEECGVEEGEIIGVVDPPRAGLRTWVEVTVATHRPTHSPNHPLTHSPTHRPTHSPTHSPTHLPNDPPTHSLTHSLSMQTPGWFSVFESVPRFRSWSTCHAIQRATTPSETLWSKPNCQPSAVFITIVK